MARTSSHQARTVLAAAAAVLALASAGCDETYSPCSGGSPIYPFAYDAGLTVKAPGDSVLLMIGTGTVGSPLDSGISINATPSVDDSVRLDVRVVGGTHTSPVIESRPGTIVPHWSGDTLQVWFSLSGSSPWPSAPSASKCSPAPEWIVPERIDVILPQGVGFRRISRPLDWWY